MKKPPKYVRLGAFSGSCLRLRRNSSGKEEYWRDAGCWGIEYRWEGDKLFTKPTYSQVMHLEGVELIPVTRAEWKECNGDYAPKET